VILLGNRNIPAFLTLKFSSRGPIKKAEMPVTLEQGEGLSVIRLEGEINIASAAGLKAALLEALASVSEVRLDLNRATDLDITALLLLWAAEREALRSGKKVALTGTIPDEILLAATDAGLDKFPFALWSK
jgi:anti-anti-sigma regulatory factor